MFETVEVGCAAGSLSKRYCAQVSAMHHEDPIGSAPGHLVYLLAEVPLPWQHEVERSVHFPAGLNEVLQQAAGRGRKFRFLAFASDRIASPAGCRRIIRFSREGPSLALFGRKEYVAPERQVAAVAEALLAGGELSAFEDCAAEPAEGTRDLFVCTHGSHDVCCGKFGYPLYKEIEERYAGREDLPLRVWRTSHFGGHRHAPTLIDFPEGRYWAQLRPELLDTLIRRNGDVERLARHYRGAGGIGAFEQVAERAAFVREGWSWIGYEKRVAVDKTDDRSARVMIEYRSSDGAEQGMYEAQVRISQTTVITGGCGHEAGEAKQYELAELCGRKAQ
ncbi:Sucrase/ferredoxin-like protein [Paenibacillus konkukensis]|uniref:Sucrase/ferredoxin-like protein n=1 Tax=Paenibacillus konkukensis TaxID=2020716 RepID=A0ABY4RS27_9BACL|nr:sucrase ferredoxin [Paenibacillus konkukensis]UQZ84202.1 Sucrase/ferredoxin-like protein [Paenibacillus konkukensis]